MCVGGGGGAGAIYNFLALAIYTYYTCTKTKVPNFAALENELGTIFPPCPYRM